MSQKSTVPFQHTPLQCTALSLIDRLNITRHLTVGLVCAHYCTHRKMTLAIFLTLANRQLPGRSYKFDWMSRPNTFETFVVNGTINSMATHFRNVVANTTCLAGSEQKFNKCAHKIHLFISVKLLALHLSHRYHIMWNDTTSGIQWRTAPVAVRNSTQENLLSMHVKFLNSRHSAALSVSIGIFLVR